ncbi:hypothetical protein NIA71_08615 [Ihubacter massiliensis]|uniref:hypothetical protein n=2 Tax=Ihubacter massiliensis TaxID=1852367 RepID=UPI002097AE00|nr:hypothetical protein [Ihubacter massiliensis]MCO7122009.1 hypothetical protein [Ihubacter massiliensis]
MKTYIVFDQNRWKEEEVIEYVTTDWNDVLETMEHNYRYYSRYKAYLTVWENGKQISTESVVSVLKKGYQKNTLEIENLDLEVLANESLNYFDFETEVENYTKTCNNYKVLKSDINCDYTNIYVRAGNGKNKLVIFELCEQDYVKFLRRPEHLKELIEKKKYTVYGAVSEKVYRCNNIVLV